MAHIISGQTEMIEHVDVLGLFLHVRTNIVRLQLNKLAYNNLQFSKQRAKQKARGTVCFHERRYTKSKAKKTRGPICYHDRR
jgi:hypothetical protein